MPPSTALARPRRNNAQRHVAASLLAALALLAASTALTGVFVGAGWLAYIALVVLLVAGIGIAARSLSANPAVTAACQLAGLLLLSVALFTGSGLAGILPGPAALSDLAALLHTAVTEIHQEVSPVTADPPLLLFCVLSLGLTAVLLDVLVVAVRAPAAAGPVLAGVYAVPALLDTEMLPWWSFAAGATGFALLLLTSRGAAEGNAASPRATARGAGGVGLAGITTAGVLVALVVAGAATPIGTVNRFSGRAGGGASGAAPQQIGLRPMTRLRGMLDEDRTPRTLFRVRGMGGHERYLRALTLSRYAPGVGWRKPTKQARGAPVRSGGILPGHGNRRAHAVTRVTVSPVGWHDRWLPVFGVPRAIRHAGARYRYNPKTGVIYSRQPHRPPAYTEAALLAQPSASQLRHAGQDFSGVPRKYLALPRIPTRVRKLTRRVAGSAHTELGRAKAIWRYFTDGTHGFSYSLSTAPKTSPDALTDFLFHGKRGFCEQYASSMAVMLRTIGIPSRVAVGFTPGQDGGAGTRTITSRDAHAWVEVFFPGYGWQTFDPTPLTDGRGSTPRYLTASSGTEAGPAETPEPHGRRSSPKPDARAGQTHRGPARSRATPAPETGTSPLTWWALLVPLLATLLAAASAPAFIRARHRRARLRAVHAGGPEAARAAWREAADSATDRRDGDSEYETLRVTAERWIAVHSLDEAGAAGLRVIVETLERSVYGPGRQPPEQAGELAAALQELTAAFARNAPLRFRDRWLPRSVLRWRAREPATSAVLDERDPVG